MQEPAESRKYALASPGERPGGIRLTHSLDALPRFSVHQTTLLQPEGPNVRGPTRSPRTHCPRGFARSTAPWSWSSRNLMVFERFARAADSDERARVIAKVGEPYYRIDFAARRKRVVELLIEASRNRRSHATST